MRNSGLEEAKKVAKGARGRGKAAVLDALQNAEGKADRKGGSLTPPCPVPLLPDCTPDWKEVSDGLVPPVKI